ncbi:HEXXH motif-containing putative peptide modification protein [Streptomyces tubbatahanensis]|uniref:HEXXH motif-containing putative peptide modification protein n=1 Tax=Streptomyces tubbatahanensis TaxID=2923272 RepID=A0ABY3XKU5_9ACTN|nr:HEXXH motif-containing putative peptide modification protein [Streptomyces tubbatahanensis]UNS95033.1 HEXXH motif-containing putative peptide modification protein [Streptomyces tubbatahanensis]
MLDTQITALVAKGRAERRNRLLNALGGVAPGLRPQLAPFAGTTDSWHHTALAHLETRARRWARDDQEGFEPRVSAFLTALAATEPGPKTVRAADCDVYEDAPYESPCWLLRPDTAVRPLAELYPGALELLAADPLFDAVVGIGAGVVVANGRIQAMSANNSWTLAGLDSSIYMDVPESPLRVAEAVLHEASHNLLFETVRAEGLSLPPEHAWYSPWKKTERPAYGFIHSVYAFSQLVAFWERTVAPSETEERYRALRLAEETAHLRSIEESAKAALALLGPSSSARLVMDAYETARSVPVPA